MSVNRYQPHVLVLPEDDANRQIAIGFLLELSETASRRVQVERVAGGWQKVLNYFEADHIAGMDLYKHRVMVLLVDFDGRMDRGDAVMDGVPDRLKSRVFVLGALTEPERLKNDLGSYEEIGRTLARECRDETATTWNHPLLVHNAAEVSRLRERVHPVLF